MEEVAKEVAEEVDDCGRLFPAVGSVGVPALAKAAADAATPCSDEGRAAALSTGDMAPITSSRTSRARLAVRKAPS